MVSLLKFSEVTEEGNYIFTLIFNSKYTYIYLYIYVYICIINIFIPSILLTNYLILIISRIYNIYLILIISRIYIIYLILIMIYILFHKYLSQEFFKI